MEYWSDGVLEGKFISLPYVPVLPLIEPQGGVPAV